MLAFFSDQHPTYCSFPLGCRLFKVIHSLIFHPLPSKSQLLSPFTAPIIYTLPGHISLQSQLLLLPTPSWHHHHFLLCSEPPRELSLKHETAETVNTGMNLAASCTPTASSPKDGGGLLLLGFFWPHLSVWVCHTSKAWRPPYPT